MNPLTQTKNLQKLIERELAMGNAGTKSSWHNAYKDSAWIFIGGLNYELNEGDVITVFSQYGEIVNINLVRDKVSGKSKGFAFICYEDQRSTVLAVDNLNGITLVGRIIRVDHVESYKIPKMDSDMDEEVRKLLEEGCAPTAVAMGSGPVQVKLEIKREIKQEEDEEKRREKRKEREGTRCSSWKKDSYSKEDESRRKAHRRRSRSRSRDDRRSKGEVSSSHHGEPKRRERSRSPPTRERSLHHHHHHHRRSGDSSGSHKHRERELNRRSRDR